MNEPHGDDAPETEQHADESSAAERKRAEGYSRTREWLTLASVLFGAATNAVLLVSGTSARLRQLALRISPARLGPVMAYVFGFSLISFVIGLPLSFYRGYVVEHRFDVSNQTVLGWINDQMKGLGLSLALAPLLSHGAFWVIRRYPRRWWAVLAGLTIPFSAILANLAPIMLAPLFNRFQPLKDRELADRIKQLASQHGVRVSDVFEMDMSRQTKKANAFFAGIGNTKRIVLGDTLLEEFSTDEVMVVVAHELGHQVHRDIWKLVALQGPVTLLTLFAVSRLAPRLARRPGNRWGLNVEDGVADVAALPLLGLVAEGVVVAMLPAVNLIVRRGIEHPADVYALDVTGTPEAFIGTMEKLGRMNLANPSPAAVVKWFLYDHPTLRERIELGQRYLANR